MSDKTCTKFRGWCVKKWTNLTYIQQENIVIAIVSASFAVVSFFIFLWLYYFVWVIPI